MTGEASSINTNSRALITGATGFVGSNLTRRLLKDGWDVHVIARPSSKLDILKTVRDKIKIHQHNGTTKGMLEIMKNAKPTVVFHLASLFIAEHKPDDIEALIQSNLLLGTQLAEAMASCQVTNLINTGTSWQHYQNEDYSPVNLYAATKQAYESILQYYIESALLKVINLKLFDTYGPNDPRPKLFTLLRRFAHDNEPLFMSPGEQLIDLVYIDDVVEAYLIAAKALISNNVKIIGIFAISSGKPISLKELVNVYSQISGNSPQIIWRGRSYRSREVMVPWSKGKKLAGWKPKIGLVEGIKNMVNYREDFRLC